MSAEPPPLPADPAPEEGFSALLDWNASVPKFDQAGDAVFFLYPDTSILRAERARFARETVEAFDLVLRQFQCLRDHWGLHDIIVQQVEILAAGEASANLQHHVKAWYSTALIAGGMEIFGMNLTLSLRGLPPDQPVIELALSPLHRYGLWFCAEGLRDHLLRVAQDHPEWMFEEPAIIEKACAKVVDEMLGIEERFSGANAPAEHLLTLQEMERLSKQQQPGGAAPKA